MVCSLGKDEAYQRPKREGRVQTAACLGEICCHGNHWCYISGEVWDLGLGVGWTKDVCGVCVGAPFHCLFDIQPAPVLDKGSRQPAKS